MAQPFKITVQQYQILSDALWDCRSPRLFIKNANGNIIFYRVDHGQAMPLRPDFGVYKEVMKIINPLGAPNGVECEIIVE